MSVYTSSMGAWLDLIRIRQWIKNSFLLFPLIFSGQFDDVSLWGQVLSAALGFCFLSSGVYIFNDYIDRDMDQKHPRKSMRPLVRGIIKPSIAIYVAIGFLSLGLFLMVKSHVAIWGAAYILLHIFYNTVGRKIIWADVLTIAASFQLRIWAGSIACGVVPSAWLQLCVFVLSLFLGFTKRRQELVILKDRASEHRSTLKQYTIAYLDYVLIICSCACIVFYGLYAVYDDGSRPHGLGMVYSSVFVVAGILRYMYLIYVKEADGDPAEMLFLDKGLLLCVVSWFMYVLMVLTIPKL